MTERQAKILDAALRLFSEHGFAAVSTSRIATEAGVSEALIFRHFKNKQGLLDAVLELGQNKIRDLHHSIIALTDPVEVVRKVLDIPFEVPPENYEFWRMTFKLKWEIKTYPTDYMQPLRDALESAFKQLDYTHPGDEAELVMLQIEGIAGAMVRGVLDDPKRMRDLLRRRYLPAGN